MTAVQGRMVAELTAFAQDLLDETDVIALRHFTAGVEAEAKADGTLVTEADTDVERRIRDRIAARYPQHGMLGEEYGPEEADAEVAWIVDPIDATHNFVRGIDIFATLVACRVEDRLVLGIVSAPAMNRRWWGTNGGGAWLRASGAERRIGVSLIADLSAGQLLYGSALALDGRIAGVARHAWRDRGFGDFWGHMLVAAGSAEAMVEDGVRPWDMAAPNVIVTEAGGRMTDLDGRDSWTDPRLVTTNGLVHDAVLELIDSEGNP